MELNITRVKAPLTCIVVEDDHKQAEWIKFQIEEAYPSSIITILSTEQDFFRRVHEFELHPPDIFIFDIMLRWTTPSPNMELPPPEVQAQGRRRAGIRCQKSLDKYARLRNIPSILYTILGENDLKADLLELKGVFVHIQKDSVERVLIKHIQQLTGIKAVKGFRQDHSRT